MMQKSISRKTERRLYVWARWQQRLQCLVNIILVVVALGGPIYLLWLQKWITPAIDSNITAIPTQPVWRRDTYNYYTAKVRKYRDCPLTVQHHYINVVDPSLNVSIPAPSFSRMRTTGKFREREFAAEPPPDLKPGVYWFWVEIKYFCYGSSLPPQTYNTRRVRIRIR